MQSNQTEKNNIFKKFLIDLPFNDNSPLYIQVATIIERAITQRIFKSGFLPAERELAKLLKVSRVTICNALVILEKKNIIYRQQGIGTRINFNVNYSLNQFASFTEKMQQEGFIVTNHWLYRKVIKATKELAQLFEIPSKSKVAYLKRVRLIDAIPISIESTYIPFNLLPHPEKQLNSLYEFWQKNDVNPAKKTIYIKAMSCGKKEAKLLNKPENYPLLNIQEISQDKLGNIIEVNKIMCLSDYYAYKVEIN